VQLHLLRHAEAEDTSSTGRDADRELTESGRKRMQALARAIASLDPQYDAILVSPYLRARQTAEPVAEVCGFDGELTQTAALLPSAHPEDVLHEVAAMSCQSVLLVGHQPHIGRLFGRLMTGRSNLEVPMKKAALAAFESSDRRFGSPELKFYLPPRILETLG